MNPSGYERAWVHIGTYADQSKRERWYEVLTEIAARDQGNVVYRESLEKEARARL